MPYKDKQAQKSYRHEYYLQHKSKELSQMSVWSTANREHLRLYTTSYRKKYPWIISYMSAQQRCLNPKHHGYHRYGGRGIRFLLTKKAIKILWDRDQAYRLKWPTIDRINNDGHYEANNCRFIEMSENSSRRTKA